MSTIVESHTVLYASDLIPCILFINKDESDNFDKLLKSYVSDKEALMEFDKAERNYASLYAVQYAIYNGTFHFNLSGPKSDELIEAIERFVDLYDDELESGNCYTPLMNFIFQKVHSNLN